MELFDQSDLRFEGMLSKVGSSHLELRKILEMVRIVSIQSVEGASMVCS